MRRSIDRRDFVRLAFLASAAGLVGRPAFARKPGSGKRVLVIGAGISGLAAARELDSNGFSVTVLEGRDRIGGRIWTDRSLGVPVDLGAGWIEGTSGNPIAALASELGLRTRITDWDDLVAYDHDGRRLDAGELDGIEGDAEWLSAQVDAVAERLDDDVSLATAIARALDGQESSAFERRALDWALQDLVTDYGEEPEKLSLRGFDEGEGFGGDERLFLDGYDGVVKGLARGLDVRLGQHVGTIDTRHELVRVETDHDRFEADRVVVTLPLGVLGKGVVRFVPELPERKRQAISRLAMGVLDRVVLRFPKVFWAAERELVGYLSTERGEMPYFLNLDVVNGSRTLVGFVGGDFARKVEAMTDDEAVARALSVLSTIYGSEIPEPSGHLVTRWAHDPFTFGSYSCIPLGAGGDDRDALATPVGDRLFFAGEATNRDYAATVHGAYLSGLREARRIARSAGKLSRFGALAD